MNRKNGFTIIEIIICLSLISIIGVSSFFGLRLANKSIIINKLEQITDKALLAAEIYIESSEEAYNNLYTEENGVIIPLKLLVNEGLLDISSTKLETKDIENEYIVTSLSNSSATDKNCIDLKTVTSWDETTDESIYICNNGNNGSNSIILGDSITNNAVVSKTRKYISSEDNYISYKNKTYRLMFIEKDDSLVLYTPEDTFGDEFIGITQETSSDENSTSKRETFTTSSGAGYISIKNAISQNKLYESADDCQIGNDKTINSNDIIDHSISTLITWGTQNAASSVHGTLYYLLHNTLNNENKEEYVAMSDLTYINTHFQNTSVFNFNSYLITKKVYYKLSYSYYCDILYYIPGKKIRLKSCMKIDGGLGTVYDPYKITDKYC